MTRREALRKAGNGFGAVGLASLLGNQVQAEVGSLAPKAPHFAPKAKQVIFLFLNGGPSQVDTFDPKPMLAKYNGGNARSSGDETLVGAYGGYHANTRRQ